MMLCSLKKNGVPADWDAVVMIMNSASVKASAGLVLPLRKYVGVNVAVLVAEEVEPSCFVCSGEFG